MVRCTHPHSFGIFIRNFTNPMSSFSGKFLIFIESLLNGTTSKKKKKKKIVNFTWAGFPQLFGFDYGSQWFVATRNLVLFISSYSASETL
mmetsp:Transcript_45613/g.62165  ORF Transcript_45613/g.62165 Transcript_45613/m.62165 type:complete len:90 (+) Transcript_45613:149-418(+)